MFKKWGAVSKKNRNKKRFEMGIEPRTFGLLLQRLTEAKPPIKIDSRAWGGDV